MLFILELLVFAIVWNSQRQSELRAPLLNLIQEEVHVSRIKAGCVSGFVGGDLLAGNEVGVCDFFAAKVSALEIALYPVGCCVAASGFDEVFTDFTKPHVGQAVL